MIRGEVVAAELRAAENAGDAGSLLGWLGVPTGELTDPATVEALTFDMPPCAGECGNVSLRAVFDAAAAVFVPVCQECEPIPFVVVS